MKTKAIIKQFFTNNVGMIFSLSIILLLNLIFTISLPILTKYIVMELQDIIALTAEYGVTANPLPVTENLSNEIYNSQVILVILTIAFALAISFYVLFTSLKKKKIIQFGNALTVELKKNVYSSIIRSDLNEIENFEKEDLKNKIINQTKKIGQDYYANHLITLIYSFALAFASLIIAFALDATIGLVCLLCAPVLYLVVGSIDKASAKRIENYKNNIQNQNDMLDYSISNLKNVKIRNGLDKEESRYNELAKKIQRNYSTNTTLDIISKTGSYAILFIGTFFIIIGLVAYNFFVNPSKNICDGITETYAVALFFFNLRTCLITFYDKQNIDCEFESLSKVLELKLENRSETINSIDEIYSLRFSNVSYYSENQKGQEINNVDFELKKGERLGILGMNTSGKTIITDLTTKVIRPTSGSITINNCDLLKINTYYLRNIITYIPQNFTLLDTTVEGNIIYPLNLDEYKYNEALNKCFIKDMLLNLPNRDKENVMEAKLSEAEKQKIALANAIYKDSPIIVLDDATTRLDSQTESKIMDEFFKLKNKIEIIASSQINIVSKCDKVLLLSNGKVLEYGKTEDLLNNKNSVFYRMYNNVAVR